MRIDDTWGKEALSIIEGIEANILITSLNKQYSYDECKQFDLIASCTTGTDHIDNREIPLIKLEGEFLRDVWATAEHTWALILSLVRKVPWAFDDVKQGNWERERWQGTELRGKTLGIVGYGRVGQQVARFAEAFGMNVWAYDIIVGKKAFDKDETMVMNPFSYWGLNDLLQRSDIITVHVPLNPETRGMFGIEQFKLMKPTAYFINTSRSGIVNGWALDKALGLGFIQGAALDVAEEYSDELKQRLIDTGKCIITSHIAGNTAESREKTQIHIAQRIKEYINGL